MVRGFLRVFRVRRDKFFCREPIRKVPMEQKYDRSAEDLGNIVALEHVNITVPDQQLATLFYALLKTLGEPPAPETAAMSEHVGGFGLGDELAA
jgi:hypothetical protein